MNDIIRKQLDFLDTLKTMEEEMVRRGGEYTEGDVQHRFVDGVYCREFFMTRGTILISKMHRKSNFLVLLSGELTIWGENGKTRHKAPEVLITVPGTKRIVRAHTDVTVVTFHGTKETSMDKVEEDVIVPPDREKEFLRTLEIEEAHKYLSHVSLMETSRKLLGRNR